MMAIGTQFYPAQGDAAGRQARARAALLALHGVVPVNLQFVDEHLELEGFRTLRTLRRDSRTVTGAQGTRKPIVSEMFDALAGVASASGCRYFAYINADIEVTPAALEPILSGEYDACAVSRTDVDPETGAAVGVQIFGLDMFAIDVRWWTRERRRFRPYIAGEGCWDNVYAALVCAHGRGAIINEGPGIFHQAHSVPVTDSPFAEHNGFLATLDAPYFSRWVDYATQLDRMRSAGVPVDGPQLVRTTMGDARLSARDAAVHAARQLRARFRYARRRMAHRREAAAASPPQSPRRSG